MRIVLVGLVPYAHYGFLSPLAEEAGIGYRSGQILYGMILEVMHSSFGIYAGAQFYRGAGGCSLRHEHTNRYACSNFIVRNRRESDESSNCTES